jgi:hypothetical protein
MWGDISQRTGTIATDMSVDAVRAVRRERGCAGWFVNNDLRTGTFRFIGTGPQNLWRALFDRSADHTDGARRPDEAPLARAFGTGK